MNIYLGKAKAASFSCRVYAGLLGILIDVGLNVFGVDRDLFSAYFSQATNLRGLLAVMGGIARYGVTRPQLLDAPFLVVWNLTDACNLRCRHCYQSAGPKRTDELSTDEKLRVVEELARAGVVSIAFSGGEPLMAEDFFDVAAKVKEEGMYLAIATNGTLITRDVAKKLKALGTDYIEVSLDSARAQDHDDFRGVKGAFEKTISGIQNCVAEGIFTCIATTVTRLNLQQVPEIIEVAKRLKVKRFMAFNFIPTGRGLEAAELDLTPEQREQLLTWLFHENKTGDIEVLSTAPQYARVSLEASGGVDVAPTHFYIGEASWNLKLLAEFIGGCGAGRLYCALQPNGDVSPCVFMPSLRIGNLRENSLIDIWHNSQVLNKLRNRESLQGNCGKCEYRFICGGCRARALAYFGDLSAPDPGCIRNSPLSKLTSLDSHTPLSSPIASRTRAENSETRQSAVQLPASDN
jgi:radical SAM protein with 4Fe4S-binding SPASM domain